MPSGNSDEEILTMVHQAMQAGAAGVCMGRQIFANKAPEKIIKALRMIIHENEDVDTAMKTSGL